MSGETIKTSIAVAQVAERAATGFWRWFYPAIRADIVFAPSALWDSSTLRIRNDTGVPILLRKISGWCDRDFGWLVSNMPRGGRDPSERHAPVRIKGDADSFDLDGLRVEQGATAEYELTFVLTGQKPREFTFFIWLEADLLHPRPRRRSVKSRHFIRGDAVSGTFG